MSNQTLFVCEVTVVSRTGFVLCLSYSVIWPVLNGGEFKLWINWFFSVQRMKSNQTCLSVAGFLKRHWLTALKSSVWIHQANWIPKHPVFYSPFHHFTLRFFSFQCSNCGSYMIWFANLGIFALENPVIWTNAMFSVVIPTLVAQCLCFLFFFKHEEIHEPLLFLKNKPLLLKLATKTAHLLPWLITHLFLLKAKLIPILMLLQGQRGRNTGRRTTHTVVERSSLQSTSSPSRCGLTQLCDPLMFETTTCHQTRSSHLEIMDILVSVSSFLSK